MIADTMGSYEDAYSSSELHKLHAIESEDLYAVSADGIDRASEQISMLQSVLRLDHSGPRIYRNILQAIAKTASYYKNVRFEVDALPQFRMSLDDWFRVQDPSLRDSILSAYQDFYVGCQMLIGVFDHVGQVFMFYLPGDGTAQNVTFPGFGAIGSGANNAMFWLSYRKQKLSCSIRRSAYHAYEAKRMAESSPHVNERIDMVIAQKGKHFLFHHDKPEIAGAPISMPEMKNLFKRFSARDTGSLDPEGQSSKPAFGRDGSKASQGA